MWLVRERGKRGTSDWNTRIHIYVCAWFTTSFCIDRLVSLRWGPTKGQVGESDPGLASFAYSPLHNPVAVIHHVSAAGRGDASATMHSHGASVRVVSTRWCTCVEEGGGGPHYISATDSRCLRLPFPCFPLAASKIPAEGIHDSLRRICIPGIRDVDSGNSSIAYCKPFSLLRFIHLVVFAAWLSILVRNIFF